MIKHLVAAAGGLALALGGVAATAPAASATPQACFYHVLESHPGANERVVEHACRTAAAGTPESIRACYFELRKDYVPAEIALPACRRSGQQ
ncbi:hypothetical protein ACWEPC_21595 [Nonomuraea sp. NPDC004297]